MSLDPHAKVGSPPWGKWEVLLDEPYCKVKKITVLPDKRLSYQLHHKRQEHWLIVEGEALVILNDQEMRLKVGDYIDIPQEASHRICNDGNIPIVFIEIQRGSYFGEDDIVRLQDDYGRKK
ncbi:MAG: phosphomannose isomerase type II C-terminal cupin domain [Deltaproteobacteria bacterium]|nr:phosphomannose isomerase type II C-terminal cupin domain [Deltaproteobacteria bacterium]